jgi:hypothetical protein
MRSGWEISLSDRLTDSPLQNMIRESKAKQTTEETIMSYATDAKPYFKVQVEKQRNSWCYRVLECCAGSEVTASEGWIKSGARSRNGCMNRGYDAAAIILPGLKVFQDTCAE